MYFIDKDSSRPKEWKTLKKMKLDFILPDTWFIEEDKEAVGIEIGVERNTTAICDANAKLVLDQGIDTEVLLPRLKRRRPWLQRFHAKVRF